MDWLHCFVKPFLASQSFAGLSPDEKLLKLQLLLEAIKIIVCEGATYFWQALVPAGLKIKLTKTL